MSSKATVPNRNPFHSLAGAKIGPILSSSKKDSEERTEPGDG